MRTNPVCWFEIYVQDMHRAKAFYEGVFAVTLEHLNSPGIEMWAFGMDDDTPGAGGSLVCMPMGLMAAFFGKTAVCVQN